MPCVHVTGSGIEYEQVTDLFETNKLSRTPPAHIVGGKNIAQHVHRTRSRGSTDIFAKPGKHVGCEMRVGACWENRWVFVVHVGK